jgi:hypothetical protein
VVGLPRVARKVFGGRWGGALGIETSVGQTKANMKPHPFWRHYCLRFVSD